MIGQPAGGERIERAIRAANGAGRPALAAYLTAGFPSREGFAGIVRRVAAEADVIELGVPFSDPMADGVMIQRASRSALAQGVTLEWILELVRDLELARPVVLMSYLNPLLARGFERLASAAAAAGVAGFIVPDLPIEESGPLHQALTAADVALVQLVTPLTPPERRRHLADASEGFLYAVARTGTTGRDPRVRPDANGRAPRAERDESATYLRNLRDVSPRPVLAGFGIRSRARVDALSGLVDGVIVGSALVERLAAGDDPAAFLSRLKNERSPA